MTSCIAKDRAFTRMFGTKAPTGLPMTTYGLFAARDMATVFASFTLPPIVHPILSKKYGMSEERAKNIAQLSCPVAIQLVSTPMHLLGLNLYNEPQAGVTDRLRFIGREYVKSTLARCGRIFPAFGIGGVLNRKCREEYF